MIALVSGWHATHELVTLEVEARLDRGEEMVIAAPALVESYAVLTRLPAPHRISSTVAAQILELSFMEYVTVALEPDAYRSLIVHAPGRAIAGGALYDAVILECALHAGADAVLTLNGRHFNRLAGEAVKVIVPGSGGGI
jgi:predicted nucleic acid-binding protein